MVGDMVKGLSTTRSATCCRERGQRTRHGISAGYVYVVKLVPGQMPPRSRMVRSF